MGTGCYDGAGSALGTPSGADLPLAARMPKVALDFAGGMAQRPSMQDTIGALHEDAGAYDPGVAA